MKMFYGFVFCLFALLLYAGIVTINAAYEHNMHKLHKEIVTEQTCIYGNDK